MSETGSAIVVNPPFPKNYAPEFLVIVSGEGVWVQDRAGKSYLDFGAGIAVNALGYGRKDLAQVASSQMEKLVHISNLYATEPALALAQKLVASGPFGAVHFGNSGSEANETALKYARAYAQRTKGEGHHKILSFSGAFHGRTLGTLSATFTPKYQDPFRPMVPGFYECSFNDTGELESILDDSFAAVLVEVIQGEGGLEVVKPDFAAALTRLCNELGVLLIVDEVQTGLARTGSLYAYQASELKPDIVTLAKPLAGGLPLSATLIPERVNDQLHVGDHGTTFGGGPVTTALGLHVWNILSDEAFIAQSVQKGQFLTEKLKGLKQKYAFLGAIKGRGLLRGIEVNEHEVGDVIGSARDRGLLVLRSGANVLRIAPPLVITDEEIEKGIEILDQVFQSL